MSERFTRLELPYLFPSQAQKHVTHNEALQLLDVSVQLSIVAFGAVVPSVAPAAGDIHALGAGARGAWAGGGALACWRDDTWSFVHPAPGWPAWDLAEGVLRVWDGSLWAEAVPTSDGLAQLGIGTQADAVNRLAVASEAALFTHVGAGHQVKINKAAATDTAAFLFQSDWTGHAEIGLTGDNALSVRTSADGAA